MTAGDEDEPVGEETPVEVDAGIFGRWLDDEQHADQPDPEDDDE
jgi:hypothetical protein